MTETDQAQAQPRPIRPIQFISEDDRPVAGARSTHSRDHMRAADPGSSQRGYNKPRFTTGALSRPHPDLSRGRGVAPTLTPLKLLFSRPEHFAPSD